MRWVVAEGLLSSSARQRGKEQFGMRIPTEKILVTPELHAERLERDRAQWDRCLPSPQAAYAEALAERLRPAVGDDFVSLTCQKSLEQGGDEYPTVYIYDEEWRAGVRVIFLRATGQFLEDVPMGRILIEYYGVDWSAERIAAVEWAAPEFMAIMKEKIEERRLRREEPAISIPGLCDSEESRVANVLELAIAG